jgi:hypothetical protein
MLYYLLLAIVERGLSTLALEKCLTTRLPVKMDETPNTRRGSEERFPATRHQ